MDLENHKEQLPGEWQAQVNAAMNPDAAARYGQPACPNSPNPCYCTGRCTINQVYGPSPSPRKSIMPPPISEAHKQKIEEIAARSGTNTVCSAEQNNAHKDVELDRKVNAINPDHYNGREVFDQMIALFGKDAVKAFCACNAFKYRSRAGKKLGNPIAQDIAKAMWYEERTKEL